MTETPWSSVGMTKLCATCGVVKDINEFPAGKKATGALYYRPHCQACKYSKEVLSGRVVDKEYHRSYYYKHKLDFKLKAYRHKDKVEFPECATIEMYTAISKMKEPCHYCGKEHSSGLDRRDNTKGHSEDNVVPCCEKCNNILGDLPASAKDLLKPGLAEIHKQNLLEQWNIPTKRNPMPRSRRGHQLG